ncbi:hypothetical protein [Fictibacillus sp. S7]|uniref:hypothetical protein n=1 Tax=Fictibacillus sp. S7 TaxID=2212476 RepID=UPI001013A9B8|nr:hypothetical protein [Fictibacillus sp. S7]RXY99185.1 hypothetical protein DMO16_05635 [Fictibacillus sp. S7]
MDILSYTLKNLLVPIIIGISSVYATNKFEQKKFKEAKEDEKKKNLEKLESHYYTIIAHVNSLETLINERVVKRKQCLNEVVAIQKLLGEVNMDILPRELKYYCGYLNHSFDSRIKELEEITDFNKISEVAYWDFQVLNDTNLLQKKYVEPLKGFLGIQ